MAELNDVLIFSNELGILFHHKTFILKKTEISTENLQYSSEQFESPHK